MKITTKHTAALARHLADALGDATTDRAELVIAGIGLDDHATYDDLAGVTHAVASDGLAAAGVTVLPLRRGAVTALFGLVRPGAPTCNACGRLALRLTGSTWQAVTASTCPVDAGLYEVAAVPVVIGWHDGREYPDGTTHDGEGVPLTEAVIRAERKVAASITAACEETGATLLEVLAAMPGATPAEALAAIVDPSRKWVSDRALRAFVRDAKGALGRRTGGAPPPPFAAGAEAPSGPVDLRALTAPSADRDAVYSALVRLLPAQFEAAVFRLSVPPHVLPGAHASMAERAVALLRIAEQRGQLAQLAAIARAP